MDKENRKLVVVDIEDFKRALSTAISESEPDQWDSDALMEEFWGYLQLSVKGIDKIVETSVGILENLRFDQKFADSLLRRERRRKTALHDFDQKIADSLLHQIQSELLGTANLTTGAVPVMSGPNGFASIRLDAVVTEKSIRRVFNKYLIELSETDRQTLENAAELSAAVSKSSSTPERKAEK